MQRKYFFRPSPDSDCLTWSNSERMYKIRIRLWRLHKKHMEPKTHAASQLAAQHEKDGLSPVSGFQIRRCDVAWSEIERFLWQQRIRDSQQWASEGCPKNEAQKADRAAGPLEVVHLSSDFVCFGDPESESRSIGSANRKTKIRLSLKIPVAGSDTVAWTVSLVRTGCLKRPPVQHSSQTRISIGQSLLRVSVPHLSSENGRTGANCPPSHHHQASPL